MVQKTYIYNSIEELEEASLGIRNSGAYTNAADRVLLAWAQIWVRDDFDRFRDAIYRLFPDCTTIGSNHYSSSDILAGRIDGSSTERSITLTFLFFEGSEATLFDIEPGLQQEERQGREMCTFLDKLKDVKGVYFVPSDYFCSSEAVMAAGLRGHKNIPVFGLKASVLPDYDNFGYQKNGDLAMHRLFVLAFHGERLNIRIHYNLGWTPVGKVMTVTSEDNPFFVNEIDGRPATEVYNKYLGLKNSQIIPQNICEFPIIVMRNNMNISRIGISSAKEGQLMFAAPVYPDERISLSYGNPDDLFTEIANDCHSIDDFHPQAVLLLVCSNRLLLLKEREIDEIELYRKRMSSLAAIYGYGEIYYLDGKGAELNSALISVAFREDDAASHHDAAPVAAEETVPDKEAALVPFADRLSRFFKEISSDLLKTADQAETANRTKSAYFSAISHDIRTLLNSILGMNEMISSESHEDPVREYSENINISGRMLLELINDILDTEKLEAGKMEIIPVDYDLNRFIKELTDMATTPAESKGLKLNVAKTGDFPPVLVGDVNRLKQCSLNLLSNAVKYTEFGEVTLKVGTVKVDDDHVMLNIGVRDTGIGIKAEDIQKLSIPFERVDQARNRDIQGTGLGLNIVRNLLGLMGSSLNITSVYNEGSEFSFSVIQGVKTGAAASGIASSDKALNDEKIKEFRAPGASILIVDDTPSNIKIMQLFLKDSQIKIDSASNGLTAIEMVRRNKYDIVFIDHIMPEMDGLETFARIKEDRESPNAGSKFIMLTANDKTGIRDFYLDKGFDDFLTKPLRKAELVEMLSKYLNC